jgi:hypothetical protein
VLGCRIIDSVASGERVRGRQVSSVESDREKESLSQVAFADGDFPTSGVCSSLSSPRLLLVQEHPSAFHTSSRRVKWPTQTSAQSPCPCRSPKVVPAFLPCVNARLTRAPQTRRPCTTARSGSGVLRHSNGAHGVSPGALRANEALTAEMRRVRPARPGCAMPRYSS